MVVTQTENAFLSEVNPEFAPLIPSINTAFAKLWEKSDTVEEFRARWATTRGSYPDFVPTDGFTISHQMVPTSDGTKIEIRKWTPDGKEASKLPLLFVLHGGGFVLGSHDTENGMSRSICVKNQMIVISVDYRQAPEHKFPTALDDSYDVYKWTIQNAPELGIDTDRIIIGGMSCGSNLVAGLALKLRDKSLLRGVIGQILNLPAVCHPKQFPHERFELNSYEQNSDAPTINGKNMIWFWEQYCPNPEDSSLASPLIAKSHKSLPPTLIQVAGLDPLRDEGIAYAKVLEEAGVETTLKVYPGLPHGFILAVDMEFSSRYFQCMVEWVDSRLAASRP